MTIRPWRGQAPATAVEPLLDHLVYAVPDLADSVAEFAERTGIVPAPGGRHLGLGTRNYLVGLGPQCYLEMIGPDRDAAADPGAAVPFGIDRLVAPRLVTWAVHPADLAASVRVSAAAGADLGAVREMSRRRPDGVLLQWRLASPVPAPFDGVTPFVIDWGSSPHPAASPDLPAARLLSLRAEHRDPGAVSAVLAALQIRMPVTAGPSALHAVIQTPQGLFALR